MQGGRRFLACSSSLPLIISLMLCKGTKFFPYLQISDPRLGTFLHEVQLFLMKQTFNITTSFPMLLCLPSQQGTNGQCRPYTQAIADLLKSCCRFTQISLQNYSILPNWPNKSVTKSINYVSSFSFYPACQ